MGGIIRAKVNFKRRLTKNEVDDIDIEDGNFIITKDGGLYTDYDEERIDLIPAIKTEYENLMKSLGLYINTYSSSSTYNVGDLVVYNHTIYECTTAITAAEVWNSTHWKIVPMIVEE